MEPKLYRIPTGEGPDNYFMSDTPLHKVTTGPGPRDFYMSASAPPQLPDVGAASSGGHPPFTRSETGGTSDVKLCLRGKTPKAGGNSTAGDLIRPRTMFDEWTRVTNKKDEVTTHIQSSYVCFANTGWDETTQSVTKCLTVLPSSEWVSMLHSEQWTADLWELLLADQRMCGRCGAKYGASWRQLVEITRMARNHLVDRIFVSADPPRRNAYRAPAMYLDEEVQASSIDLYNNLLRTQSTLKCILDRRGDHICIVDCATWDSLQWLPWSDIFAMIGAKIQEHIV
jgi:hypothetical protein